jgi:hypothetical protein
MQGNTLQVTLDGIEFPEGLESHEWEVESKGWLAGVVVIISGRRYIVEFYDPVRLVQDMEDDLQSSPVFFEANMLVVESVTRARMVAAIEALVADGRYRKLLVES